MKKLKLFFTPIFLILFFSCSDAPIGFDGYYNYPLEEGLSWKYNRTFLMTNFRPIDSINYVPDTNSRSEIIEVISEGKYTFENGITTFVLKEQNHPIFYNLIRSTYYISKPNALYRYAYSGGGVASPKTYTDLKLQFVGLNFNNIYSLINYFTEVHQSHQDSLYIESPPSLVYKYPLKIGSQWNFVNNPIMKIDKEIIRKEIVSTPGGQFNSHVIKWSYKFKDAQLIDDSNITCIEYLSSEGLIKRTFLIKNVAVIGPSNPDVIGYMDIIDELILTNISSL